jgi:ComEC/Rec2-related protein
MKRPMCVIGAAFALTMWVAFFLSVTTALLLSAACFLTALLAALLLKKRARSFCAALLCCALALGVQAVHAQRSILPFEQAAGQTVTVEGLVLQADRYTGQAQYTLRASFPHQSLPDTTLLLRVYGDAEYVTGDCIRAEVTLSRLPAASVRYYRSIGVYSFAAISGNAQSISADHFGLWQQLLSLRRWLDHNLRTKLPDQTADLVGAMALRLDNQIPALTNKHLQRSGISHIFAVSGLHLSIAIGLLVRLLQQTRLPRRLQSGVSIAVTLGFMAVTGFPSSIVRAGIMLLVALVADLSTHRRADSLNSLGAAVFLIALFRPTWVLGAGLWLSVSATCGVLLPGQLLTARARTAFPAAGPAARFFISSGCTSIGAYLFSAPILLLVSGWMPLLAPIVNLLAAPFLPGAIAGGLLCAVIPGNSAMLRPLVFITRFCTQAILALAAFFADIPGMAFALDEGYHLLWIGLVIITLLLCLLFRRTRPLLRFGALLCVLSLSVGSISLGLANRNIVELITLTGCDTAIVLRGADAVLLGTPTRYEISTLSNYLDYRNIQTISAVIAFDCGEQIDSGLLLLDELYTVGCIIAPDDSFILSALADTFPHLHIFPDRYAAITALHGMRASISYPEKTLSAQIGAQSILKSTGQCAIIKKYNGSVLRIYSRGAMLLPKSAPAQYLPLGRYLYGETRVLLHIE